MWLVPYYIASIVIAIILIIKDWKEVDEFLDDLSSDEEKAFMISMMIVLAPGVILFFIIVGCINLYFYVKNHHTNKKIDLDKQLNKLPKLMAEYDRLLRKPEVNKHYESRIERVKLRNWDEK
jgi:hypothetical protein